MNYCVKKNTIRFFANRVMFDFFTWLQYNWGCDELPVQAPHLVQFLPHGHRDPDGLQTQSKGDAVMEAKKKWGQTQAYKEYEEKKYSKQEQDALATEMDKIMAEFALCMKKGEAPESIEAQGLVKLLQNYITEHYYHCTNQILAGLGQMYVADERFQRNIDKHADGTAAFICEAINIYCRK